MKKERKATPDFFKIAFKTLTPVEILKEKHRLIQALIAKRNREGLSQAELGRKADISQSRIAQIESGIEKGPVTFDMIFLLFYVLGLDVHIIMRPKRKRARVR